MTEKPDPDPCPWDGGRHNWQSREVTLDGRTARYRECSKCRQTDDA